MSKHSTIYVGENTHVVEVLNLRDNLGNVQSDAVVQVVSVRRQGSTEDVEGLTLPIPLAHVEGGDYRAIIPHGADFRANRTYELGIQAMGSQGYFAEWSEKLLAVVRRA